MQGEGISIRVCRGGIRAYKSRQRETVCNKESEETAPNRGVLLVTTRQTGGPLRTQFDATPGDMRYLFHPGLMPYS